MGAGRQHSVLPTILILNEADLSWTLVHFFLACVFKNNNYSFENCYFFFLLKLLTSLRVQKKGDKIRDEDMSDHPFMLL